MASSLRDDGSLKHKSRQRSFSGNGNGHLSLTVAFLYNSKTNAPHREGEPSDMWAELDGDQVVHAITGALRSAGHRVIPMEGDAALYGKLLKKRKEIDIAFNICEGHHGESRESQIPAMLELLEIPYTGSKVLTLALTLDKAMTKRVLAFHGLPTPAFQIFQRADERLQSPLQFPLFVKPNHEGTGKGVNGKSVVRNLRQLREQVAFVVETYRQPALVEQFIEGREITIGMVGNERLHVFPSLEVDLTTCPAEENRLYTSHVKSVLWDQPRYLIPAPLPPAKIAELNELAMAAFRATGCLDVARVDFRLDAELRPWLLEVNPLPGLAPGISDLVMMAEVGGWTHAELVNTILETALRRYGMLPQPVAERVKKPRPRRVFQPVPALA